MSQTFFRGQNALIINYETMKHHNAFCPQNESSVLLSVHESMCSFQYFVTQWCLSGTKGFTVFNAFVH